MGLLGDRASNVAICGTSLKMLPPKQCNLYSMVLFFAFVVLLKFL